MKRLLSLILCFTIVFSTSSVAFATTATEDSDTIELSAENQRVTEIPELREVNSDTYLLSDGTYECVVYAEDKYYEDEYGNLTEIDNTLVELNATESDYRFSNTANNYQVFFADSSEPGIMLRSPEGEISFSPVLPSEVQTVTGSVRIGSEDIAAVVGIESSGNNKVTYSNIYENVDMVYSVENGGLKEYIIMKNADAPHKYEFVFTTDAHTPELTEDGRVVFIDEQENVDFVLGNLFAVDNAGVYTEDIYYDIKASGNSYIISVTISDTYVEDSDREYPIVIDPSVMVTGASSTYDTYVSSKYPTTNYYLNTYLRTGRDEDYYIRRTYIKFDIPSTVSKYISSAYIYMRMYSGATPAVYAYRVTGDWNSSSITWNNKPGYTTTYGSGKATLTSNNWYSFDVTRLVSAWQKGTYSNFGFLIKDSTESSSSQWTTFYSSDAASPNKPELRIVYTPYDTTLMAYKEYRDNGTIIPRSDYFTSVKSYVTNNRGGNTYSSFFTSYTHDAMVTRLQSTLIFIIHTHGMQTGVYLGNGNFFTTTSLEGVDLSNLRCVLLLTCETGVGGYSSTRVSNNNPVNIVERMVICGAKTVIGFKEVTYVSDCNLFAENFAQRTMSSGYSIYNAIYNMDCSDFYSDMSNTAVIGGNSSQTLTW